MDKADEAVRIYEEGYSCAQAVFGAFAEDMGVERRTAYRFMEGYGGGMGGMQGICGALTAAFAVISYRYCEGLPDKEKKHFNYAKIQEAAALFAEKYGDTSCLTVLHGEKPAAHQCAQVVRDAVEVAQRVMAEQG